MPSASSPIQLEHLTKRYGEKRGVEDVTIMVEPGEAFGFLGPNGAGKTTKIRVLMGWLRPTAGNASIFGQDCWRHAPYTHPNIGFIPGDLPLYESMGVVEFLRLAAALHGGVRAGRAEALAARLDLDLRGKIRHLSRGNRQKLGLVQALMHEAPLLILDEPSLGLDPLMGVVFTDLVREERDAGRTVFLSSHNLSEVERICDRVAIIREGRVVTLETVDALKAKRVRQMSVLFREAIDPRTFESDGVVVLDRGERRLRLAVRGDINPVIRRLARFDVHDLTLEEPDLEDVFLHFYRDESPERASA